jgi:hypothetical protein
MTTLKDDLRDDLRASILEALEALGDPAPAWKIADALLDLRPELLDPAKTGGDETDLRATYRKLTRSVLDAFVREGKAKLSTRPHPHRPLAPYRLYSHVPPVSEGDRIRAELDALRVDFERDAESAREAVAKWARALPEQPTYHLRWGDAVFSAATLLEAATTIGALLGRTDLASPFEAALVFAREQVFYGARRLDSSTSASANLVERSRCSTWSEYALESGPLARGARLEKRLEALEVPRAEAR